MVLCAGFEGNDALTYFSLPEMLHLFGFQVESAYCGNFGKSYSVTQGCKMSLTGLRRSWKTQQESILVLSHHHFLLWIKQTCRDFPGGPMVNNLLASVADKVWSLVREDPTGHRATSAHNHCCLARAHALQQEKPPQWEAHAPQPESSPCFLQLEKVCSNKDPV